MKLNFLGRLGTNSFLRALSQRYIEAPMLRRMAAKENYPLCLEIGCGRGIGAEIIIGKFGAERVIAIDIDPEQIDRAKRHLKNEFGDRVVHNILVIIGFVIMWKGWKLIHGAKGEIVTSGLYAYVRHPQYSGLFLVMIGMIIQWPTIITALMFPVLIYVYYRLSKREEAEMLASFGERYKQYIENTPMFMPRFTRKTLPG